MEHFHLIGFQYKLDAFWGWPHWSKFLSTIERAISEFGLRKDLYYGVIVFLKGGGFDLLPNPVLPWLREIVNAKKHDKVFWDANGESTVEVIRALVSEKFETLSISDKETLSFIADVLVDNGIRGAGFFQQELLREGTQTGDVEG